MDEPIRIKRVAREVLGNKLLVALDDDDKVAVVYSAADVRLVIKALDGLGGQDAEDMAGGMRRLLDAAFGDDPSTT